MSCWVRPCRRYLRQTREYGIILGRCCFVSCIFCGGCIARIPHPMEAAAQFRFEDQEVVEHLSRSIIRLSARWLFRSPYSIHPRIFAFQLKLGNLFSDEELEG